MPQYDREEIEQWEREERRKDRFTEAYKMLLHRLTWAIAIWVLFGVITMSIAVGKI